MNLPTQRLVSAPKTAAAPVHVACGTCNVEVSLDPGPDTLRDQIQAFAAEHDDHPQGWSFQVRIPLDSLAVEADLDPGARVAASP